MAFSLNKVMLIGNLGQDAENRFTNNNVSVTSFSIATTYGYKGKDGNWVNETTWHNVVGFNLSDFLKDKLKKGAKFYVEGRLSKRSYEDKEGKKQYFTEVIADSYSGLIPLDPASGGSNYDQNNSQTNDNSAPAESKAEDDDLPF